MKSNRYIPITLAKLIKTSASIGLKEVRYEQPYNETPDVVLATTGVPPGTQCKSHRSMKTNMIIWEAKWP
jgi:hypothetical protein